MAEAAEKKAESSSSLSTAADRLRDSAKWLVAGFGAVAAIVFAGLTVSDLGALRGDTPGWRLAIALAGVMAAFLGIVVALSIAMRLAGASTTSLEDLTRPLGRWEWSLRETRAEVKNDPALTTWGGDVADFIEEYRAAYDEFVQQAEAYTLDPNPKPDESAVNKADYRRKVLHIIAERLLHTTGFLRLQRSFVRARVRIAVSVLVTAAGAVAFAWATSDVPDETALESRPIAGQLRPDEAIVKELARQGCKATIGAPLDVVALDNDKDAKTLEVLTVPETGCPPVKATVPMKQFTPT